MDDLLDAPVAGLADLLLDAICLVDASGRFVFVSAACESIFGYTREEMTGKLVMDLVAPTDRARTMAAAQAVMQGRSHTNFENRYVRKDGSVVHIMWSARWLETEQLRVAVARDVTPLKQAQAMQAALYALSEAAHACHDLPSLFQRCHDIIGELLPASAFAVALPEDAAQALRLTYHAGDTALAAPLLSLCEDAMRNNTVQSASCAVSHGGDGMLAVPLTAVRETVGVLALCNPGRGYTEHERSLLLFVANQFAAAIQRKQLQARMHFMAMHDELTQLPNRRLFLDRLETALARAQRHQDRLSLLFIDLNRFKQVNDRHGHAAGDRLLQEVARRIGGCVRESDTVARLGGDEFVVLLESVALPADAEPAMEKIHHALAAPFVLGDGLVLEVSASIGAAHYPQDGDSVQALMSCADIAMYCSKKSAASTEGSSKASLGRAVAP